MPSSILIVDDEADLELLVLHNFRRRIAAGELAFLFAANGEEALRVLQAHPAVELIVTDINMPVMDGLTLLARVSELDRLLRVVIVSAYDDLDNIRTAMNRGAYDFLTKPIDFADVEKTIDKSLRDLVSLREGLAARTKLASLEYELSVATRIQRSILPEMISGHESFQIAATMLPAREVSGDFYDFFLIDSHRMGLAIGDVSGKGIPAALFMAVCRTLLRATALQGGRPHECLEHVNRVLLRQRESEVFLTLLYGILDLETGDFEFSAGAQPPPCLYSREGRSRFLHEPRGMMLGVMDEASYDFATVRLGPGDGLLLYTDGVTEAESSSDKFFTSNRLADLVDASKGEPVDKMVDNIVEGLKAFTLGREQSDDITMLAIRFKP
jgi:sigma-B regulation protein RsbU (phosphoserine phosphatase)